MELLPTAARPAAAPRPLAGCPDSGSGTPLAVPGFAGGACPPCPRPACRGALSRPQHAPPPRRPVRGASRRAEPLALPSSSLGTRSPRHDVAGVRQDVRQEGLPAVHAGDVLPGAVGSAARFRAPHALPDQGLRAHSRVHQLSILRDHRSLPRAAARARDAAIPEPVQLQSGLPQAGSQPGVADPPGR